MPADAAARPASMGFMVGHLLARPAARRGGRPGALRARTSCRSSRATARGWRAPACRAAPASIVAERLVDLPGMHAAAARRQRGRQPAPDPQPRCRAGARPVARAGGGGACCWRATCAGAPRAERELAEALAFRKAMEDSLVTGLRARDLQGRITYVNPAFCADGRLQRRGADRPAATPPYWPPELAARIRAAPGARGACAGARAAGPREGFEIGLHAQERRALPGADLRGAAGRRRRPPDRLDERRARHQRRSAASRSCRASSRSGCRPPRGWRPSARWPRC